jgi:urocanate hydratase
MEMLFFECSRAGADVLAENPTLGREFKYPSYVQDIMGPMCFDYGFGRFVGFVHRKT